MRTAFRTGVATALLILVAGCSAPASHDPNGQQTAVAVHADDLRSYLLPVPADAAVEDVGDGSITLDQDAAASSDPAQRRATLTGFGFKAEAIRRWTAADGTRVDIVLIRFGSPSDALDYLTDVEEASAGQFTTWPVDRLPGALIFVDPTTAKAGSIQVEGNAVQGDTAILIFDEENAPGTPTAVSALLTAQFTTLANGATHPAG